MLGCAPIVLMPFAHAWHELAPLLLWLVVPCVTGVVGAVLGLLADKRSLSMSNLLPLLIGAPGIWMIGLWLFGP